MNPSNKSSLLNQDHSIRMVRIASDAFESAMEPPMDADHLIDEVAGGTNPWQGDRYADLAPTSSSNIDRSASSQQEQLTADLIRLPLVTGIGPVAQSMACLQMLAMYFNIPFRKDVMERICTQELRDRSANLSLLAGMCSVMGFHPTLLNLPSQQVPRAHVPCLAIIKNQPSVIYKIAKGEVLAVVPEYGRVTIALDELLGDNLGSAFIRSSWPRCSTTEARLWLVLASVI